jgi:hypothetical protein
MERVLRQESQDRKRLAPELQLGIALPQALLSDVQAERAEQAYVCSTTARRARHSADYSGDMLSTRLLFVEVDDPALQGEGDGLRAVPGAELLEDALEGAVAGADEGEFLG